MIHNAINPVFLHIPFDSGPYKKGSEPYWTSPKGFHGPKGFHDPAHGPKGFQVIPEAAAWGVDIPGPRPRGAGPQASTDWWLLLSGSDQNQTECVKNTGFVASTMTSYVFS